MIKVKFFNSFGSNINTRILFQNVLDFLPNSKYGKDIIFTDNENDYTHAVIINTAMPSLTIPKENVLGLAFEPPQFLGLTNEFINYSKKYIGKYYIGSTSIYNLSSPFIEHHGFMWFLPLPKELKPKNNLMSIIFSQKSELIGHKYRHSLVYSILNSNLPIDIYGTGCDLLSHIKDSRIKGKFTETEPYDSYKFTIAIENISLNDYISEKCTNSLIYETTPLYYGAKNIDKYFPDTYIRLIGNIEEDIKTINEVIKNPDKYVKNINRYEILSKMNLIDHLLEIFTI